MPSEAGPDGMVAVWSPLLRLEQRLADGKLRFWDREAGQYRKLKQEEERQHRHVAEARAEREARGRRQAESRIERAQRGQREAESRAESAERAPAEEKRVTRDLEVRLAEFEAESRSSRSRG